MTQYVTFYLGEERFAINILIIREIGKLTQVIPVPESSPHVVGIMNFRGQILTLIDPHVLLDQESELLLEQRSLMILKTKSELRKSKYILQNWEDIEAFQTNDPLAILIDGLGPVIADVRTEDVHRLSPHADDNPKSLIKGVIRKNEQMVNLLSLENLISQSLNQNNQYEAAVA